MVLQPDAPRRGGSSVAFVSPAWPASSAGSTLPSAAAQTARARLKAAFTPVVVRKPQSLPRSGAAAPASVCRRLADSCIARTEAGAGVLVIVRGGESN